METLAPRMRSLFFFDTGDTFECTANHEFSEFGIWKSNNQPDQTVCGNIKLRPRADNKHSKLSGMQEGNNPNKTSCLIAKNQYGPSLAVLRRLSKVL